MLEQLANFAFVVKIEGDQTASTRKYLGLSKNKADKSLTQFNTHAVDGVSPIAVVNSI